MLCLNFMKATGVLVSYLPEMWFVTAGQSIQRAIHGLLSILPGDRRYREYSSIQIS